MDWKTLLAYITGTVDQELLLRNEYLVTENRILRNQLKGRIRLSDGERKTLAVIGQKLGKQALKEVARIVKPDTILGWHRTLVAQKCDGSQQCKAVGRPKIDQELEALVVRIAQENRSWGYDRIVGALTNLGYTISDQTVGNILKRHGLLPAPERKTTTTWKEFIRTHMDVLVATDFFTAEVWTLSGLVTYYVLFFIHLGSREVHVAGVTPHPNEAWMVHPGGAQCHHGDVGRPVSWAVPHPRPGREILSCLSAGHRYSRGHAGATAAAVAKSECLRGAVGAVGQGRMSLTVGAVWGSVTPPCADAVCGAFSSRAESSGQGQRAALSYGQPRRRACRPTSVS
jgi:hypothetical protein